MSVQIFIPYPNQILLHKPAGDLPVDLSYWLFLLISLWYCVLHYEVVHAMGAWEGGRGGGGGGSGYYCLQMLWMMWFVVMWKCQNKSTNTKKKNT